MDLSDANPSAGQAAAAAEPGLQTPESQRDEHWYTLLSHIGQATAQPLTRAIERVSTLAETGRIDRAGLLALRAELDAARHAGIAAQQMARLANGEVRQAHEKVHLGQALQDVLTERQTHIQASGCQLRTSLRPAEVMIDPTLLFSLLHNLLDWSLSHARGQIHFVIDLKAWPVRARLGCRFRPAALADGRSSALPFDDLPWMLLQHTALAMGLGVEQEADGEAVSITLEFPRTVNNEVAGLTTIELDHGFSHSVSGAKPLAGSHVLVIAARRDVRVQVRDAIRNMGLIVDFVSSVEEAAAFCRDGAPNGIVVESALRGDRFDELVDDMVAQRGDIVFIEIVEEGATFEISGFSGSGFARVGRDAIAESLPSALVFELSKSL
jgi:hypothetical protein